MRLDHLQTVRVPLATNVKEQKLPRYDFNEAFLLAFATKP